MSKKWFLNYKRKQLIAFLTLTAFCAVSLPYPSLAAPVSAAKIPAAAPYASLEADQLSLPKELGSVASAWRGTNAQTVLILQDAHSNPEAQKKIQKLIRYFQKTYGIQRAGLEGSSGRIDPQLFRSFPDQKKLKQALKPSLEKGELSAGILAAIFPQKKYPEMDFYGVEDWALYEHGLEMYLRAAERQAEIIKRIEPWTSSLRVRKEKLYSPKLLEIDRVLEDFSSHPGNLIKVLESLAAVQSPDPESQTGLLLAEHRHNRADAGLLEGEVKTLAEKFQALLEKHAQAPHFKTKIRNFQKRYQQFLTSEISPQMLALSIEKEWKTLPETNRQSPIFSPELLQRVEGQKRMEAIEGGGFLKEFHAYARSVKESLLTDDEARALDQESRLRVLIQKMAGMELSREEWDEYQLVRGQFSPEGEAETFLRDTETSLRLAQAFYENAEKRDEAFLTQLGKEKGDSLLIAGGFHAQGVAQRLKARGISYAVILPSLTSVPENSHYREHMSGSVSWRSYFEIENGRISVYRAFVRYFRDQLLGLKDAGNNSEFNLLLKSWRDQVIRDLAEKNQVGKAGDYTWFLDEASDVKGPEDYSKIMQRVNRFLDGVVKLEDEKRISKQNISDLLALSQIAAVGSSAAQSPELTTDAPLLDFGDFPEELIGVSPQGAEEDSDERAEARSETRGAKLISIDSILTPYRAVLTEALATQRRTSMEAWDQIFYLTPLYLKLREQLMPLLQKEGEKVTFVYPAPGPDLIWVERYPALMLNDDDIDYEGGTTLLSRVLDQDEASIRIRSLANFRGPLHADALDPSAYDELSHRPQARIPGPVVFIMKGFAYAAQETPLDVIDQILSKLKGGDKILILSQRDMDFAVRLGLMTPGAAKHHQLVKLKDQEREKYLSLATLVGKILYIPDAVAVLEVPEGGLRRHSEMRRGEKEPKPAAAAPPLSSLRLKPRKRKGGKEWQIESLGQLLVRAIERSKGKIRADGSNIYRVHLELPPNAPPGALQDFEYPDGYRYTKGVDGLTYVTLGSTAVIYYAAPQKKVPASAPKAKKTKAPAKSKKAELKKPVISAETSRRRESLALILNTAQSPLSFKELLTLARNRTGKNINPATLLGDLKEDKGNPPFRGSLSQHPKFRSEKRPEVSFKSFLYHNYVTRTPSFTKLTVGSESLYVTSAEWKGREKEAGIPEEALQQDRIIYQMQSFSLEYGAHTELALLLMLDQAEKIRGHETVDLGHGASAILTLAALKLGAKRVFAVDGNDKVVADFEKMLELNDVPRDRVVALNLLFDEAASAILAHVDSEETQPVVIANIPAKVLIGISDSFIPQFKIPGKLNPFYLVSGGAIKSSNNYDEDDSDAFLFYYERAISHLERDFQQFSGVGLKYSEEGAMRSFGFYARAETRKNKKVETGEDLGLGDFYGQLDASAAKKTEPLKVDEVRRIRLSGKLPPYYEGDWKKTEEKLGVVRDVLKVDSETLLNYFERFPTLLTYSEKNFKAKKILLERLKVPLNQRMEALDGILRLNNDILDVIITAAEKKKVKILPEDLRRLSERFERLWLRSQRARAGKPLAARKVIEETRFQRNPSDSNYEKDVREALQARFQLITEQLFRTENRNDSQTSSGIETQRVPSQTGEALPSNDLSYVSGAQKITEVQRTKLKEKVQREQARLNQLAAVLKKRFPHLDWENASAVSWQSLVRGKESGVEPGHATDREMTHYLGELNQWNYWINQIDMTYGFFLFLEKILNGEVKNTEVFSNQYRELHKILLTGDHGDTFYWPPTSYNPSISTPVPPSDIAGRFSYEYYPSQIFDSDGGALTHVLRFSNLIDVLNVYLNPAGQSWDEGLDQMMKYQRNSKGDPYLFPHGNHSFNTMLLNTLLRLKGYAPILFGNWDLEDDSSGSAFQKALLAVNPPRNAEKYRTVLVEQDLLLKARSDAARPQGNRSEYRAGLNRLALRLADYFWRGSSKEERISLAGDSETVILAVGARKFSRSVRTAVNERSIPRPKKDVPKQFKLRVDQSLGDAFIAQVIRNFTETQRTQDSFAVAFHRPGREKILEEVLGQEAVRGLIAVALMSKEMTAKIHVAGLNVQTVQLEKLGMRPNRAARNPLVAILSEGKMQERPYAYTVGQTGESFEGEPFFETAADLVDVIAAAAVASAEGVDKKEDLKNPDVQKRVKAELLGRLFGEGFLKDKIPGAVFSFDANGDLETNRSLLMTVITEAFASRKMEISA